MSLEEFNKMFGITLKPWQESVIKGLASKKITTVYSSSGKKTLLNTNIHEFKSKQEAVFHFDWATSKGFKLNLITGNYYYV